MKEPEVTDAEFEVVTPHKPWSWWGAFWLTVYACSAGLAAMQTDEPGGRFVIAFTAAWLVPLWRVWAQISEKVSEEDVQALRRLQRSRPETIWTARRRKAAEQKALRLP